MVTYSGLNYYATAFKDGSLNFYEQIFENEVSENLTVTKFELSIPQGYVSCIKSVLKSQNLLYLATNLGYIYKVNMSCMDFDLDQTFSLVYPQKANLSRYLRQKIIEIIQILEESFVVIVYEFTIKVIQLKSCSENLEFPMVLIPESLGQIS